MADESLLKSDLVTNIKKWTGIDLLTFEEIFNYCIKKKIPFQWHPKAKMICKPQLINSMKLVIPLHLISWKEPPNDAVTPQHQSQFTPKMKANAVPRLLSSLVWIDQYNECNGISSFMEFMCSWTKDPVFGNPIPTTVHQGHIALLTPLPPSSSKRSDSPNC